MMIIEKTLELTKKRKTFVLATVIESSGSAPGKVGFKLIYTQDHELFGTVGGGLVEAKVLEECKKRLETKESTTLEYRLTSDEKGIGMNCGGTMKIFLEVFKPQNRLILFGGGHVGFEIAKFANLVNLETILIEEREHIATEERFPNIAEIIITDGYKDAIKDIDIDEYSYIVIVTKGSSTDKIVLKQVIDKPAAYLGLMGSKRKRVELMKSMKEEGYSEELLASVYCPIGLDLKAVTPAEIALSVIAEVVAVKNKGLAGHLKIGN